MRKPDAKEVRRQFIDLFIVTTFCTAGLVTIFLLSRSDGFAQMLGTTKSSDRHVLVSCGIGVGLAAVMTIGRLWFLARRKKKGDDVA